MFNTNILRKLDLYTKIATQLISRYYELLILKITKVLFEKYSRKHVNTNINV